jgi:soluble lytic murein transglycosylase
MQILPRTATRSRRTRTVRSVGRRLYNPDYNVRFGCAYLRGLLKKFEGDPEKALAAYNAGDFRVTDWLGRYSFRDPAEFLEAIPIAETRGYVEAVLRDAAIYRQLISGSPQFAACPGEAVSPARSVLGEPPRRSRSPRHRRPAGRNDAQN